MKSKKQRSAKRCRFAAGVCLTVLLLAQTGLMPVLAFNHYSIDVETLKETTKQDTFEVSITKKTVADGVSGGAEGGPDILTLSIDNMSESRVDGIVVMVVCFDDENKACAFEGSSDPYSLDFSITPVGSKEKRELYVYTFDGLNVSPGASFQVTIPCKHNNFTGASALVAQYTTDSGEEVTNPLAEEWQELALGSPTHILD